jgi:hypothetical protein
MKQTNKRTAYTKHITVNAHLEKYTTVTVNTALI